MLIKKLSAATGRRADVVAAGLVALSSLIVLPVFLLGLPCSHDAFDHLARVAELYFDTVRGAPFLQWGPDLMRGYGHPILAFYAPLTYWLLALPRLVGVDFAVTYRFLSFIALPIGGVGLYVLARRYLSTPAAFVAALAYLFAPYTLFDAIQRGALPETLALAFLPYALAAFGAAARRATPSRVALASLLLALLITVHNLVPFFAIPLALLVAVFEGIGSLRPASLRLAMAEAWRGLWPAALAIGLALFMTVAIWLPAVVEEADTLSGQPTLPASPDLSNWPRYYANLVPTQSLVQWPAEPGDWQLFNAPITRSLGLAPAVLAVLALIACLHPAVWRRWPVLVALGVAGIGTTFLSSQSSRWIWDHSRTLQVVQLPTRFLGPASLSVALLGGLAVELALLTFRQTPIRVLVVALPALAVAISGWPWLFPRYCTPLDLSSPTQVAEPPAPFVWLHDPVGELLPRWVQELPPVTPLTDQYSAGVPVNRLALPAATVTLAAWQTHPGYDKYVLDAKQATPITYQTFYFPGWQAWLDGKPIGIGISSPSGLMVLDLPAGHHTLEISFHRTPLRTATLAISGLSVGLWVLIALRGRRQSPVTMPGPSISTALDAVPNWVLPSTTGLMLILFFIVLPRSSTPVYAQRLNGEQLAGVQNPASFVFESELRYLGYAGPKQISADGELNVVQYWKPEHPLGVPYGFDVRLADDLGHVWSLPPDRPFDWTDYQGSEGWPASDYIRDAYLLHLLPGTPPGQYWLETSVFRRDVSQQLVPPPGVPTDPDPAWARVGQVQVTVAPPAALPPDLHLDTYRPAPLQAGLSLLGWSLPSAGLGAGDTAHVTLLWQATQGGSQSQAGNAALTVQLTNVSGQALASYPVSPGGPSFPLSRWTAGTIVRDQLDWRMPPSLPTGHYGLRIEAGSALVDLGGVDVTAPDRVFARPPVAVVTDQTLGFARLAGYTVSSLSVAPGDKLSLQLVWQAVAETARSYRVFVHLRDAAGLPAIQSDAVPAQWTRPTTGWAVGEFIVDTHTLVVGAGTASGDYSLVAGLYDPATGERLGEITLATVKVQ